MPRRRLFNSFWGNLLNNGGGNQFDYGQGPNMGIGPPPGGLMDNGPVPRGVMGQPGFIGTPRVLQGGNGGPPQGVTSPPPTGGAMANPQFVPGPSVSQLMDSNPNTGPANPGPLPGPAPVAPSNNFDPNSITPFVAPPPPSVGPGPDATMIAGAPQSAPPGQAIPPDGDLAYRNQILGQRRANQNAG